MVRTQEAASGVDEHPGRVHDEVAHEVRRDVRVPDDRPVRYVVAVALVAATTTL